MKKSHFLIHRFLHPFFRASIYLHPFALLITFIISIFSKKPSIFLESNAFFNKVNPPSMGIGVYPNISEELAVMLDDHYTNLTPLESIFACIKLSVKYREFSTFKLASYEQREASYKEFLNFSRQFQQFVNNSHEYRNYKGPWIEHHWINYFCCSRPLKDFGFFIPIFLPWLDIASKFKKKRYFVGKSVLQMMRSDCLYLTVSQADYGLEIDIRKKLPSNLFVLSGTNNGNVPIPMNIWPQETISSYTDQNRLVFMGNVNTTLRKRIISNLRKMTAVGQYNGSDWVEYAKKSTVQLVLPGVARGTFRLKEIMDLGGIPAIIFNDYPWIPYYRVVPYEDFGFVVQENSLSEFVKIVSLLNQSEIENRRRLTRKYAKSHFTIDKIMNQIEKLMLYGFTQSDLRCAIYRFGKHASIK